MAATIVRPITPPRRRPWPLRLPSRPRPPRPPRPLRPRPHGSGGRTRPGAAAGARAPPSPLLPRRAIPPRCRPVGQATAWGCAAALAYLQAYAAKGFTLECPGYAEGREAMTCMNQAGGLPRHVGDRHRRPLPAGLHERGVELVRAHRRGGHAHRSLRALPLIS